MLGKEATRDFTSGDPGRQLIIFALPLITSMILQNLYNTADAIVVGRFLGEGALAAVGTSGVLTRVVLMLISGATQGMSVIVSQFFGANEEEKVKRTVTTSLYLIVGLSTVFGALGAVFSPNLLSLIKVPEDVMGEAITYLRIILAGSVVTALYNMASFLSRSLGDSVTPTIILVITSILNVGFNLAFVIWFNMGVSGVAYGTLLATLISAVICWTIVLRKMPIVRPTRAALKPDAEIVRLVAKIGVPSALQSSTMSIAAVSVQALINLFGSTVMAAYSAATKIEALFAFPPGGITQGMQVFTGQNVGAGRFERVHEGFKAGLKIIAGYSVFSTLVLVLASSKLMGVFTKQGGNMVKIGSLYLIISGLGAIFCGILFHTRSTLIGAGDATAGVAISFLELGIRVSAAFVLSRFTSLGYLGVFIATPIAWIVAGGYGMHLYKAGRWKAKRVTETSSITG